MGELSNERRTDMIVGAMEGGSNYWCALGDTQEFWDLMKDMAGEPHSLRVAKAVLERGGSLPVEDRFSGEVVGVLSLASIKRGEKLMHDEEPHHYADILKEQDDAATADVWFQFCLMDKLVYG